LIENIIIKKFLHITMRPLCDIRSEDTSKAWMNNDRKIKSGNDVTISEINSIFLLVLQVELQYKLIETLH